MFRITARLGAALTLLVAVPAAAVLSGGTISAGTVFTRGGAFLIIANPAGLTVGNDNFDDNNLRAFNELQDQTLESFLTVNDGGSIVAGTDIDSHYLVFDPRRNQTVEGSVSFATRVLGVIYSLANLQASDFLGAPGVTYLNPPARGLEPPVDAISFSGNTVNFSLSGSSPGDTFRVITAANVPEPAVWVMLVLGFGLVGFSIRRRTDVARHLEETGV